MDLPKRTELKEEVTPRYGIEGDTYALSLLSIA
jgi:hypothetical protein